MPLSNLRMTWRRLPSTMISLRSGCAAVAGSVKRVNQARKGSGKHPWRDLGLGVLIGVLDDICLAARGHGDRLPRGSLVRSKSATGPTQPGQQAVDFDITGERCEQNSLVSNIRREVERWRASNWNGLTP